MRDRGANKRHRYCMVEWACRCCWIVELYMSLHRLILIANQFVCKLYKWVETQKTNQRQCDHGQWPDASVGQQYRKGKDRLVHQMLTVLATVNPEKSLVWDPDPSPSSFSRTYA